MAKKYKAHIFVVDDDSCICDLVLLTLEGMGYKCSCFEDAGSCLERLAVDKCDVLLTDVRMPEKGGIEPLVEVKRSLPWLPVLMMTSYADIPMSVEAVKAGAFNFIEKPLDGQMLLDAVETALRESDLTNILRGKLLTKTEAVILNLILQGRSNDAKDNQVMPKVSEAAKGENCLIGTVSDAQTQPGNILEAIWQIIYLADPRPHITVGLSNLSQVASEQSLINRIWLAMAMSYGLDSAIVDVLDEPLVDAMATADMLLNKQLYSDSYLKAYRNA